MSLALVICGVTPIYTERRLINEIVCKNKKNMKNIIKPVSCVMNEGKKKHLFYWRLDICSSVDSEWCSAAGRRCQDEDWLCWGAASSAVARYWRRCQHRHSWHSVHSAADIVLSCEVPRTVTHRQRCNQRTSPTPPQCKALYTHSDNVYNYNFVIQETVTNRHKIYSLLSYKNSLVGKYTVFNYSFIQSFIYHSL